MTTKISKDTWAALKDTITELITDEIMPAERTQILRDVAHHFETFYLGQHEAERKRYCASAPDDATVEALRMDDTNATRALADRFAADGVTADFQAGIQFVCRLIKHPDFEY